MSTHGWVCELRPDSPSLRTLKVWTVQADGIRSDDFSSLPSHQGPFFLCLSEKRKGRLWHLLEKKVQLL